MLPMVLAVPVSLPDGSTAPVEVEANTGKHVRNSSCQLAPGRVEAAKMTPVAAERFLLHVSIGRRLRDKLEYAQQLASHQIEPGDVAEVLERSVDLFIAVHEKTKFAATSKPRPIARPAT